MSRTLKFYGASDDLFEVEGTIGGEPDEIGCYDETAAVKVANEHGGLFVVAHYAPKNLAACWSIGLMQLDEDVPLPNWPMKWSTGGRGYSVLLEIEVPDSAVVSAVAK